jgi:hypothetical protein
MIQDTSTDKRMMKDPGDSQEALEDHQVGYKYSQASA